MGGHRKRGRPKLRSSDVIRKDMKEKGARIQKHTTGERKLVAPTPNRQKAEEEEDFMVNPSNDIRHKWFY